jgi:hypothetical protein
MSRPRGRCCSRFGPAGDKVVVEEFLEGEEASFIAMVDGSHVLPLATSQDHKRLGDGDAGPNTGGMGAYSPAPVVTPAIHERAMHEVMWPTVRALAAEGTPYVGFLYAGLMIDASGTPKVLEFNCRFGDPETQPILARMRSDITALCEAALEGRLSHVEVDWDPRAAVGVVLAAAGYPERCARATDPWARWRCTIARQGIPRQHRDAWQRRDHERRTGAVRSRTRRHRSRRAARGLRARRRNRLGRHAVPPRHWLSRGGARTRRHDDGGLKPALVQGQPCGDPTDALSPARISDDLVASGLHDDGVAPIGSATTRYVPPADSGS